MSASQVPRVSCVCMRAVVTFGSFDMRAQDEDCEWFIDTAKRFVQENGWLTDRHAQFPTTDFALESCDALYEWFIPKLHSDVMPALAREYGVSEEHLAVNDLFVVRYEGGDVGVSSDEGENAHHTRQSSLEKHYDDSLLSFNVLLSRPTDFTGGGTEFAGPFRDASPNQRGTSFSPPASTDATTTVLPENRGDVVLHCGKFLHGGKQVTSGVRYVLVGFIDVVGPFSQRAYREYLIGLGRLTQARRLRQARRNSTKLKYLASTGHQRQALEGMQYRYAASALRGDASERAAPAEFVATSNDHAQGEGVLR